METLYSEIKNYIVRIKTILVKEMDKGEDVIGEEEQIKMIDYLLILGEEKAHLRSVF